MGAGVATPASCAKRAFEKQGHTVFLFTPKMWPELFDEAGTFDAAALSRFFEVQRPDYLMLAEGIGACGLDAAVSRGVAAGMLVAARSEAEASVAKSSGAPFDFAITISGRSLRLEEVDGFEGVVGARSCCRCRLRLDTDCKLGCLRTWHYVLAGRDARSCRLLR